MTLTDPARVAATREAMVRSLPPTERLREICQRVLHEIPEARTASLTFVDDYAHPAVIVGDPELAAKYEGLTLPLEQTYCASVISLDVPIYAPDVRSQPILESCLVRHEDFPGYAGYPVRFRGQVVAAIAVSALCNTLKSSVLYVLAREAVDIEGLMKEADR